ncbi:Rmf/CrpP family protein [Streptomyces noursei]|uniref:Rmf/CrpP family protein n=1 Tax=Streptomyces noursei TaxID=1971 RepID=UPI0030F22C57
MGFREDAVRARRAGYVVARSGRPVTDCPHASDSPLRLARFRGYNKAIPFPIADNGVSIPQIKDRSSVGRRGVSAGRPTQRSADVVSYSFTHTAKACTLPFSSLASQPEPSSSGLLKTTAS